MANLCSKKTQTSKDESLSLSFSDSQSVGSNLIYSRHQRLLNKDEINGGHMSAGNAQKSFVKQKITVSSASLAMVPSK